MAMIFRRPLLVLLCLWPILGHAPANAAEVTDSTGRAVKVPDRIARVLPAGPPAAVLVAAIAPDLMIGWPGPLSEAARALLPTEVGKLPQVPRLTGREDVIDKVKALKPDLIVDYGAVTPRYFDLAAAVQDRTGVPTLLYTGALEQIPRIARELGTVLHRQAQAERVALFAEAVLALPPSRAATPPRIVYARGTDGLLAAAPNTEVTEVFTHLGWTVVAPNGQGTFRATTIDAIAALDPDWVFFSDPAMHATLKTVDGWKGLRAVREGRAIVVPSLPFGWVEESPSINRLLGLAWLGGHEPAAVAALFHAIVYGRVMTPEQLTTVLDGAPTIRP